MGQADPEQPPSAPRRWGAFVRNTCGSRRLHGALHGIWMLVKVAAVLLFLVWAVGIPGALIEERVAQQLTPLSVNVTRVTWNPRYGFVLHDVDLTLPGNGQPALTRGDIAIRPDYRAALGGIWHIQAIILSDATLELPLTGSPESEPGDRIRITRLRLSADRTEAAWMIEGTGTSDLNSAIAIRGELETPSPRDDEPVATALPTSWLEAFQKTPTVLREIRTKLLTLQLDTPPELTLEFRADASKPTRPEITLQGRAPSFVYAGHRFAGAGLEAAYAGDAAEFRLQIVESAEHSMTMTGKYQANADQLEAHVYGEMDASGFRLFLPGRLRRSVDQAGVNWEGTLHTEGWIGPCSWHEAPYRWGGWLSLENGRIQDFPAERLFATFKREGPLLLIQEGLVQGGEGPGRGVLRFTIKNDFAERRVDGGIDFDLELRQLAPVLPPGLARVSRMFEIRETPIRFAGGFSLPHDAPDRLVVTGMIHGANFSFRGAELTSAQVGLLYSNNLVLLNPFDAQTATGGVRGSLNLDLRRERYEVDLEITANPLRVAPMAGANFLRHVLPYTFSDDIIVRASGMIDAKTDRRTDLTVQLSGRQIGRSRVVFDRLQAQAHRGPGLLTVSNFTANIADGIVSGVLVMALGATEDRFTLSARAEELSFDRIVGMINRTEGAEYEGRLQADLSLEGRYPDPPAWSNLTGRAQVRIDEGRLLTIPVFGGLSTLLGKIYPGLGFSEQNVAEGDFVFGEGEIRTDNFKLAGNLISLAAKGSYAWTNHLQFAVQVHPFRDGSLASAVRVVTIPLSMLMEFKVTGPLRQPNWRTEILTP